MFDRFRKNKDETEESGGSEMVEERPREEQEYSSGEASSDTREAPQESEIKPQVEEPSQESQPGASSSTDQIGIRVLMDKRVKLEEAIDYVGLMIKNLKDKRTKLEKDIEDESVDIKNLKEKLMKVSEYIDEENQGIQSLTKKRTAVESEADDVGNLINSLRSKLSGIDNIVNAEGDRIKNFKESKPQ